MNPIKKWRELRRELRRATGPEDRNRIQALITALETEMTPKQRQAIQEEYQ